MSESVRQDLPATWGHDHIALPASADQLLVIRKAAELAGWTVGDYILSTVLDRAERDLYTHAAAQQPPPAAPAPLDPYVALLAALT